MAVEREIRPRRIKYGNAAEHQRRVFCHAYARFLIGFDAFRFDEPTRIAGRTGIEFGIDELVQPFAFHFRFFADALEAAAVFFGIDADVFARAGIVFQVVHQSIAADGRTVLIQRKAVARPDGIAGLVVIRPIGVQHFLIALDDDIAFGADGDFRLSGNLVRNHAGVVLRQRVFAAAFDFRLLVCFGSLMLAKQAGIAQGQFILIGRTTVFPALNRRRGGPYRLVIGRLRQRCILRICPSRAEADA